MDVGDITAVLDKDDSTSPMLVPGMKYHFCTHTFTFFSMDRNLYDMLKKLLRKSVSYGWGCTGRWTDGEQPWKDELEEMVDERLNMR